MRKNYTSLLAAILLIGIIAFIFYRMMPSDYSKEDAPLSEFSTARGLKHIKTISKEPHYVGSSYHQNVINYLESELKKLGLETEIQKSTVLSKSNNLVETQNIIARIKGSDSSKALLLLTHYDSAPHSKSYGASDDANGLAVILEGVRTFLHNNSPNKNDIIIVFSDAEELGLNGAYAFATEHPWAKNVGLVLNFEARGTKGPSMMLAETNGGNANLIKGFSAAGTTYPVSNSLMYSIYKMLPNDTDLTAFREKGNIPGFNFAYIDDHFDYHTVQDNYENFTPECLEHQATYLMPLLTYFANTDLDQLKTNEDHVYFNVPFGFVHYPFGWNLPLLIVAFILFFGVLLLGFGKRVLDFKDVIKGFVPFLGSLFISGFVVFLVWKAIQSMYPQYQDMLHKFTYNGHSYIYAFICVALAICFWMASKFVKSKDTPSLFVAPLFFWLVLNVFLYFYLEGASFFIVPAYFGIIILGVYVIYGKSNPLIAVLFSIPTLIILVPFIQLLPIGLGLDMLAASALFVVFTFYLLLPVFGQFSKKTGWGWLFFLIACGFFIKAHWQGDFEKGKGKPNSLLYIVDAQSNENYWVSYDQVLDPWTKKYLGENPGPATELNKNAVASKYNSGFSYAAKAPEKNIPKANFTFIRDTIIGDYRAITLEINANRNINRMDVFAHENLKFHNLTANGVKNINQEGSYYKRKKTLLLNYYPINNKPLTLSFQIKKEAVLDMDVMTASFDLMENPQFKIAKRPDSFIPMPFVLNDAIVVKQKIKKEKPIIKEITTTENDSIKQDSLTIKVDSLETN